MTIRYFKNRSEMADFSGRMIVNEIQRKNNLLLCAATGDSPTGTYQYLADHKKEMNTDDLRVIKLDEWGGVPMDNENTCESYVRKYVTGPLSIKPENYFSFKSDATDPEQEALRIRKILIEQRGIDVCVLGLGMNGHIAFNEPADFLNSQVHVAKLSVMSRTHKMVKGMTSVPEYGLTLGMADIMASQLIIMLISGENKKEITKKFLKKEITTLLPASFLWQHENAICCITEDVIK